MTLEPDFWNEGTSTCTHLICNVFIFKKKKTSLFRADKLDTSLKFKSFTF